MPHAPNIMKYHNTFCICLFIVLHKENYSAHLFIVLHKENYKFQDS